MRTDAEAETPILWPTDVKKWLLGKDPDAGKDWRQEEKGTTEDEMVGWHHQPDGHEFEQAPGVGDRQGILVYGSPWDCKELDMTEWLNWTDTQIFWCIKSVLTWYAQNWTFDTQTPPYICFSHNLLHFSNYTPLLLVIQVVLGSTSYIPLSPTLHLNISQFYKLWLQHRESELNHFLPFQLLYSGPRYQRLLPWLLK